jgi:hypothetical protein
MYVQLGGREGCTVVSIVYVVQCRTYSISTTHGTQQTWPKPRGCVPHARVRKADDQAWCRVCESPSLSHVVIR